MYKIPINEVKNFSQIWDYKGVTIPLQEAHLQFAHDFATVMLSSFIEMCNEKAQARKKEQETKRVVLGTDV
jgi:hypothetical protein